MNAKAQVDPSDMPILRTGIDFTLTQLLEKGFLHAVRDTFCSVPSMRSKHLPLSIPLFYAIYVLRFELW